MLSLHAYHLSTYVLTCYILLNGLLVQLEERRPCKLTFLLERRESKKESLLESKIPDFLWIRNCVFNTFVLLYVKIGGGRGFESHRVHLTVAPLTRSTTFDSLCSSRCYINLTYNRCSVNAQYHLSTYVLTCYILTVAPTD